jgi:hypothetical protein
MQLRLWMPAISRMQTPMNCEVRSANVATPPVIGPEHATAMCVDYGFSCRVCGAMCPIAPEPPARAVCEAHCEDHDYRYERDVQGHRCIHCDAPRPEDWGNE